MTSQRFICQNVSKPEPGLETPIDVVVLDYEERYLRRKVLQCQHGNEVLVDLPKATVLEHGDWLILETGEKIEVIAGEEDLVDVRAGEGQSLVQLAYHLGNRHLPVQIEPERLVIKRDHVIEDMLAKMGAITCHISEPFNPEGGAYGHGRTHGHDHGHDHDQGHDHDH